MKNRSSSIINTVKKPRDAIGTNRIHGSGSVKLFSSKIAPPQTSLSLSDTDASRKEAFEPADDDTPTSILDKKKTLVLDVAYRPISVVNWKRALVMEMLAKAEVLEYYDDIGIQSVNDVFPLPAVMKVCFYVKNINSGSCQLNASRKSILMRDRYECQYCGSRTNLTIDHVIPISRGGEWKYDNLVTACSRCNTKKGSKLPHECRMHPKKAPSTPKFLSVGIVSCIAETVITGKAFPTEWQSYMPQPDKFFEA